MEPVNDSETANCLSIISARLDGGIYVWYLHDEERERFINLHHRIANLEKPTSRRISLSQYTKGTRIIVYFPASPFKSNLLGESHYTAFRGVVSRTYKTEFKVFLTDFCQYFITTHTSVYMAPSEVYNEPSFCHTVSVDGLGLMSETRITKDFFTGLRATGSGRNIFSYKTTGLFDGNKPVLKIYNSENDEIYELFLSYLKNANVTQCLLPVNGQYGTIIEYIRSSNLLCVRNVIESPIRELINVFLNRMSINVEWKKECNLMSTSESETYEGQVVFAALQYNDSLEVSRVKIQKVLGDLLFVEYIDSGRIGWVSIKNIYTADNLGVQFNIIADLPSDIQYFRLPTLGTDEVAKHFESLRKLDTYIQVTSTRRNSVNFGRLFVRYCRHNQIKRFDLYECILDGSADRMIKLALSQIAPADTDSGFWDEDHF